jgi:hypothetical protein
VEREIKEVFILACGLRIRPKKAAMMAIDGTRELKLPSARSALACLMASFGRSLFNVAQIVDRQHQTAQDRPGRPHERESGFAPSSVRTRRDQFYLI